MTAGAAFLLLARFTRFLTDGLFFGAFVVAAVGETLRAPASWARASGASRKRRTGRGQSRFILRL